MYIEKASVIHNQSKRSFKNIDIPSPEEHIHPHRGAMSRVYTVHKTQTMAANNEALLRGSASQKSLDMNSPLLRNSTEHLPSVPESKSKVEQKAVGSIDQQPNTHLQSYRSTDMTGSFMVSGQMSLPLSLSGIIPLQGPTSTGSMTPRSGNVQMVHPQLHSPIGFSQRRIQRVSTQNKDDSNAELAQKIDKLTHIVEQHEALLRGNLASYPTVVDLQADLLAKVKEHSVSVVTGVYASTMEMMKEQIKLCRAKVNEFINQVSLSSEISIKSAKSAESSLQMIKDLRTEVNKIAAVPKATNFKSALSRIKLCYVESLRVLEDCPVSPPSTGGSPKKVATVNHPVPSTAVGKQPAKPSQVEVQLSSLIYHIDNEGYLLDENGCYLVEGGGGQVRLSPQQRQLLHKHRILP